MGPTTEPGRVGVVGRRQGLLPGLVDRVGSPEMHRRRRMPSNPRMAMNVIVLITEPGRVGVVGRRQGLLPGLVDRVGSPEMHRRRRMPSNPRMAMNVIVLIKEVYQELLG